MSIDISRVSKRFGAFTALDDVSLQIPSGSLAALLGPSGCGKTTLLRIIAGLEQADSGRIAFEGEDTTARRVQERGVGFVFQHYALFKHMTVFENVAFGLTVRPRRTRPSKTEIRDRVMRLLQLVQLDWTAGRYPSQLSGGQRQRIALARALAVEPKVLLLDEPFGALDAKVRRDLRRWLRRLHDELHVTSVFVTHDQEEALEVADQVVVMNQGRVEQVGAAEAIYEHPATPFVYEFIGQVNRLSGHLQTGRMHVGEVTFETPEHRHIDEAPVTIYVRPQDFEVAPLKNGHPAFAATVQFVNAVGSVVRLEVQRADTAEVLEVEVPRDRYVTGRWQTGDTLYLTPRRMHAFAERHALGVVAVA